MPLSVNVATLTLESMSPYSQSRKHSEPRLAGERPHAYMQRTWRAQQHIQDGTVHIPSAAIHQGLVAAAKYSKKQIPGQGKSTWTKKFESGVVLFYNIDLGMDAESASYIEIFANADGVRGSGKRVTRWFPMIDKWSATFDINILDPIITEDVFADTVEQFGMFIGIGRYRPEKGGTNGRFRLTKLAWQTDPNQIALRAA